MKTKNKQRKIYVYADWEPMPCPQLMGILNASPSRGKEIFSFEYTSEWLNSKYSLHLDPNLELFSGPQYPQDDHINFGSFLDSSPDRWGRVLMRRKEEQAAREEQRTKRNFLESDYLLGVFDAHRMGALRFKLDPNGEFLDNNKEMASPPWTELKELERASLKLEKEKAQDHKDYSKWLNLLIAPGGSLGGARPKASVIDNKGQLWIAKFPSQNDDLDVGAWEFLTNKLARLAKINTPESQIKKISSKQHTFLTKRFDRLQTKRIHFASAMTMLGKQDGSDAHDGSSYLDIVDFLIRNSQQTEKDLEELWRRIVFNICVSNTDDHLRNHGFLLLENGWQLAPAYDLNPSETGNGLKLNISLDDNSQSLDLALEVLEYFRIKKTRANTIITEVTDAVSQWEELAKELLPRKEISRMQSAFRLFN